VNKFRAQLAAAAFPVVGDFFYPAPSLPFPLFLSSFSLSLSPLLSSMTLSKYNPFVIHKVMETVYSSNQKAIDAKDTKIQPQLDYENPNLFNTGKEKREEGEEREEGEMKTGEKKLKTLPLGGIWQKHCEIRNSNNRKTRNSIKLIQTKHALVA
jgi:hypothetical protein